MYVCFVIMLFTDVIGISDCLVQFPATSIDCILNVSSTICDILGAVLSSADIFAISTSYYGGMI